MTAGRSIFDCLKKHVGYPRNGADGFARILNSNRFYWLLSIIILPVPMLLAYHIFPIGCQCPYGSVTAGVFDKGMGLLWVRLFLGFFLGEKKNKIAIYLIMPFVIAFVVSVIGQIVWPHPSSSCP